MPTVYGSLDGGGPYRIEVILTVTSQNVAANTSTCSYTFLLRRTSSVSAGSSDGDANTRLRINGVLISDDVSWAMSMPAGGATTRTIRSGTVTIAHDADGTKTVAISAALDTDTSAVGSGTLSDDVDLPTIPRATQPTVSGAVDAGGNLTINTPRASSSFTHTLTYAFGDATGTIATGVATSQVWAVPLTLLDEIPNAASGTGTITCKTYNGATLIGTKTVGFTVNAGAAIVPDFTTITHSEANSVVTAASIGAYVQSLSKLALAITGAAGVYGSTITAYEISVDGQTITSASGTTPSAIGTPGTVTVTGKITDSRGRTKTKTVNVTVLAYTPPKINSIQVRRSNGAGVVDANTGTYARIDLDAAVQSLVVGTQKNALTYKIESRLVGGAYATKATTTPGGVTFASSRVVGTGGEYSIASSYEVQVTVSDKFGSIVASRTIATAQVPLDVAQTGIGAGKIWEQGSIDAAAEIYSAGKLVPVVSTDGETQAGTSAQKAVTPASLASVVGIGVGYRYAGTVIFTSSGTFSKGSYPGLRAVRVRVVGGGGAGGGATAAPSGQNSHGAGGGGGGYAESFITDIAGLSSSVAVTVGAGASAAATDGGSGGASSFGSLVAAGGGTGGFQKAASTLGGYMPGGVGGEGTAGDILLKGAGGGSGFGAATLASGGIGGSSALGGGGGSVGSGAGSGNLAGATGGNYGGGGGGAAVNAGGSARSGGAGAPGIVLVEIYR